MHVNELISLHGKKALVIGGAGKIGFPIAEALGEVGATVIIASRSSYVEAVEKLNRQNLKAIGYALDHTDEAQVKKLLEYLSANQLIPDILINCAVTRPMKLNFDDTVAEWERSMISNSQSLFSVCKTFAIAMIQNGGGSIINVASIYGLVAPDPWLYEGSNFETEPDYPYNKGGMIMFSKYLAAKFARKGLRVNVIAPGGFFNYQGEPFYSRYCQKVPMGRMAHHSDLKGAAVFLASNLSSYITGAVLPVDGGFTIV